MNATSSGVAFSAAKIRSPSFSRSSSSMTTTALPAAISATARSTESSLVICATLAGCRGNHRQRFQYKPPARSDYCQPLWVRLPHQSFDVLRDDVDLEVDRRADRRGAQGALLQRGLDQRHLEPVMTQIGDGQRHPVDGDRPLLDDVKPPRPRGGGAAPPPHPPRRGGGG